LESIVFFILSILIVALICTVCTLALLLRKQYATISDLLDRITAPDFHTYQSAREKEHQRIEVVKASELLEEYVEGKDGLRID